MSNNPLLRTDPDGREEVDPMVEGQRFLEKSERFAAAFNQFLRDALSEFVYYATDYPGCEVNGVKCLQRTIDVGGIKFVAGSAVVKTGFQGVRIGTQSVDRVVRSEDGRKVLSIAIDSFSAENRKAFSKWFYGRGGIYGRAVKDGIDEIRITFMKSGGNFTAAEKAAIQDFKAMGPFQSVDTGLPYLEAIEMSVTPKSTWIDLLFDKINKLIMRGVMDVD